MNIASADKNKDNNKLLRFKQKKKKEIQKMI